MRIGYAPGRCLRAHLVQLGYSQQVMRQAGLVTATGHDTYIHRVVFPLEGNPYGRSLSTSAPAHRFLSGSKGGLYSWDRVRHYPEVRHPPQSGWLDELGRLKGGRPWV
jgi:hypothetical protein